MPKNPISVGGGGKHWDIVASPLVSPWYEVYLSFLLGDGDGDAGGLLDVPLPLDTYPLLISFSHMAQTWTWSTTTMMSLPLLGDWCHPKVCTFSTWLVFESKTSSCHSVATIVSCTGSCIDIHGNAIPFANTSNLHLEIVTPSVWVCLPIVAAIRVVFPL